MKYFLLLSLFILPSLVFAQDATFVPLTQNAPFLEDLGNAASLPDFLNDIYRLCIGAAAALAVLQIMRAGIMYMGGDSVTEKKEAKNLIAMSIGGLILVLSPIIVFTIINPEILSLKISGLEKLKVEAPTAPTVPGGAGNATSTKQGNYYSKIETRNADELKAFENACGKGGVRDDLKSIIASYSYTSSEKLDGTQKIYTGNCQTVSTQFIGYYTATTAFYVPWVYGEVSEWKDLPGDNFTRQQAFYAGCGTDGGKFSAARAGATYTCTAAQREILKIDPSLYAYCQPIVASCSAK